MVESVSAVPSTASAHDGWPHRTRMTLRQDVSRFSRAFGATREPRRGRRRELNGVRYGPSGSLRIPFACARRIAPRGRRRGGGRHSRVETTRRYAHLAEDPLREATERIGATISAALDGKPPAEVVPLRGA